MEPTTTAQLVPPVPPRFDEARLAIGGFLARYSGSTRSGYASDLRAWFAWCDQGNLDVFAVRRVHIELYARWMEEDRHLARATIGRRLSTVVGFYRFAVVDGHMAESPAQHIRRPKIDTESTTLGLDRMELGAFLAQAAAAGPVDHALAGLLGLLGLRVSEACAIDIGVKGFSYRRVKNDERDAADLADLLRMGRLPEAWIAPPGVRELRETVRHRDKLVRLRSGLNAQVHAVLGKEGVLVPVTDLFGVAGRAALDTCPLGRPFAERVASLQRLIDHYDEEIGRLDKQIALSLRDDAGYQAIQVIPGVGPILAAVFVAEIGDVRRFPTAPKLCCWAGLTPRHHESDTTVHRGRISKQGSKLVRWAAIEAAQKAPTRTWLKEDFHRIAERRNNRPIARVAIARKILTLVFYGLRDGEIRGLASPGREQ